MIMIIAGIILMVLGYIHAIQWKKHKIPSFHPEFDWADTVSLVFIVIGAILSVIGMINWLWSVL